jgi:hypothetical protein
MALFFNWASRYGHASQDILPFFFGYERTFSFIGVRELVALLLGYERTFSFIGVRELVALLLGYERLFSFRGVRELRCAPVNQKRNNRTQ